MGNMPESFENEQHVTPSESQPAPNVATPDKMRSKFKDEHPFEKRKAEAEGIRQRIKLSPEKAIFIFVDEVLPPTAALMSSIYEEHKDEDGFLYITYSGENTFGSA